MPPTVVQLSTGTCSTCKPRTVWIGTWQPRLRRNARFLVDAELFGASQLVQDQADLDRTTGPLVGVGLELLRGLVRHLQVALEGGACPVQLLHDRAAKS